jgi:hypothetical protein
MELSFGDNRNEHMDKQDLTIMRLMQNIRAKTP